MMYLGGKSRTARRIVDAISAHAFQHGTPTRWVEPFMGGGSVVVEVARRAEFAVVQASDLDSLVVAYWTAIRDGWSPPASVTYEEYIAVRSNPDAYPAAYAAHVAYSCSFGGKRWGGYARGTKSDGVTPRNYAAAAARRDNAARPYIGHVKITCANYIEVLPAAGPGDVVYCDPPYEGTTGYRTGPFDHAAFWSHIQDAADRGALVYVSEYAHPDHIVVETVWSNNQTKSVRGGTGSRPRTTDNVFFIRPTA